MSIISTLANSITTIYLKVVEGALSLSFAASFSGVFYASLVITLLLSNGMVKIPVSFFKLHSDGKIKATETSVDNEVPVRLNSQGILPLIMAMLVIEFVSHSMPYFAANLSPAMPYSYYPILFLLVFGISQTPMDSTPTSLTTYLKQVNGIIPGVRPGSATLDFLKSTLAKARFIGGFTLASLVTVGEMMDQHMLNVAGTPVGFSSLIILISTISSAKRQFQAISQAPKMEAIVQRM